MRAGRLVVMTLLVLIVGGSILGFHGRPPDARAASLSKVYLPLVNTIIPPTPFLGFETSKDKLAQQRIISHVGPLNAKWVRLNGISWRDIQPTPARTYRWDAVASFERDLRAASAAGLSPMVVVVDSPRWATTVPSSCAAIAEDHFDDFAAFMSALVKRYQAHPFNVHTWELGNEPDVDPGLLATDSHFGCWGNRKEQFYGGEHYGNMLKVVTPAIKQADPQARVFIGGLLMDRTTPCTGQVPSESQCFFEGILKSGAADYFDVVAYHAYASMLDEDKLAVPQRKVEFLKEVMARYTVSKPLFLNETSLRCPKTWAPARCTAPGPEFFEDQANFAPQLVLRTVGLGVEGVIWYTLNGSGWDNGGLLDGDQKPRPAYRALRTLSEQTTFATEGPVAADYGAETEAYRFNVKDKLVDVVWSRDGSPVRISVPAGKLLAAYGRDGQRLSPKEADGMVGIQVGAGAVYVQRRP